MLAVICAWLRRRSRCIGRRIATEGLSGKEIPGSALSHIGGIRGTLTCRMPIHEPRIRSRCNRPKVATLRFFGKVPAHN